MEKTIFIFLTFLAAGLGFATMPIAVSLLLGRHRKGMIPAKELHPPPTPDEIPWLTPGELANLQTEPYESGMPSAGPWRQIGFEYIIYVILFLIFDMVFVALFFSMGAWLEIPGFVTAVIAVIAILGSILIFYALKPRTYLKL